MRRMITVTLGADSAQVASELVHLLRQHRMGNQLRIEEFRVIPWNTLTSHVKADIREGGDPDLDLLGVSRVTVAKVTRKNQPSTEEPF